MRPGLRSLLRRILAWALGGAARLSGRRVGLVLLYHTVAERNGDPQLEIVPPHGAPLFEAQLRHLRSHYRVVAAEELQTAAAARRRGERFPVAVTFDDDAPSHRAVALPILERVGVSATFFLCGASLDRPFAFWWERLQEAADRGLDLPLAGNADDVACAVEEMAPAERDLFAAELERLLGPPSPDAGMRGEGVRALAGAGQHVGFHTQRHDRLPPLDDDLLASAMSTGREALEAAAGSPLESIAYPHGHADSRVAAAARAAGFQVGFTTSYEPVTPASEPLLLGRIEPARSLPDFALQLVALLIGPARRRAGGSRIGARPAAGGARPARRARGRI